MKRLLHILLLAAICCAGAAAQNKDYAINVGDFHEFTVVNNINVIYRHSADSMGMAAYTCPPSVASDITFTNKDGKLKIETNQDPSGGALPTITIYSLVLTKATNWGDSTVVLANVTPGAQLKLKVMGNGEIIAHNIKCTKAEASLDTGNGHIFISGKCQQARLSSISTGSIEAGNLQAAKVSCSITGTGSIDCYATEYLKVTGIASGTVYYRGNPELKNKGIGIKVVKIKE